MAAWEITDPDVQLPSVLPGGIIANPACMMPHAHKERSNEEKGMAQYLANSS